MLIGLCLLLHSYSGGQQSRLVVTSPMLTVHVVQQAPLAPFTRIGRNAFRPHLREPLYRLRAVTGGLEAL